jgi:ADP-ribosylglycohydrolase
MREVTDASRTMDHEASPIERSRLSTRGLAVGDAFGERLFEPSARAKLASRTPPRPPWRYTDDTVMALGLVEVLDDVGEVDQDALAQVFARRYAVEPHRGYGAGAHQLMRSIRSGSDWDAEAGALFGNEGSFGNGAAMRVAPLGAYFADDLEAVVEQARRSARVTHQHPEGVAGAIAVATAAASAWSTRDRPIDEATDTLWRDVLDRTPESDVRDGLGTAEALGDVGIQDAAAELGNGSRISAMDTVPFVVWSACHALDDYEDALWRTVSAGGDRDTTCAMVGGITALRHGVDGIPGRFLDALEELDW